mmetsp:Transcript_5377/g.15237  ORF Transcript_5377/g.15237 Transcript_5377/m.15237 type:complete len:509 (-) Transcript_5377:438-1964(-)
MQGIPLICKSEGKNVEQRVVALRRVDLALHLRCQLALHHGELHQVLRVEVQAAEEEAPPAVPVGREDHLYALRLQGNLAAPQERGHDDGPPRRPWAHADTAEELGPGVLLVELLQELPGQLHAALLARGHLAGVQLHHLAGAVHVQPQHFAGLGALLGGRDELAADALARRGRLGGPRASGLTARVVARLPRVLLVHLHQLPGEPVARLLHAVGPRPRVVALLLELAHAPLQRRLLLRHLQLDLAALLGYLLLEQGLVPLHPVQLLAEVADLLVLLRAELLPVVDGAVEGRDGVVRRLQALLEGLLVLGEVAGQDVEAGRAVLEDLEPLLELRQLALELVVAVLWRPRGRRHHKLRPALGLLQVRLQLLVLLPEPPAVVRDGAHVGLGLAQRRLHLHLVADGLVALDHGAPELVHQVGHLVDAVPGLLVVAPGREAPLQEADLVDVRLPHLGHHLHGLLRLIGQLPGLPLRLQEVPLQCVGLLAALPELFFEPLGLRLEGLLLRGGDR